jgi:hypothetical protein
MKAKSRPFDPLRAPGGSTLVQSFPQPNFLEGLLAELRRMIFPRTRVNRDPGSG